MIQGKRAARARSRKQGSMHGDYARVGRAEVVCVVFAGCCRGFEVVGILRGPKVVRVLVFKAEVVRAFAMRHDCIRALFAHNAAPHSGAENIARVGPRATAFTQDKECQVPPKACAPCAWQHVTPLPRVPNGEVVLDWTTAPIRSVLGKPIIGMESHRGRRCKVGIVHALALGWSSRLHVGAVDLRLAAANW